MKKKEENLASETPEQVLSSSIRDYFTKEINSRISEMSVKEMESTLKNLAESEYWIAILKYMNMRLPLLDTVLRSVDPVINPSKISWSQGCMAGMCDLQSYVIDLNSAAEKKAKEKTDSNIVG